MALHLYEFQLNGKIIPRVLEKPDLKYVVLKIPGFNGAEYKIEYYSRKIPDATETFRKLDYKMELLPDIMVNG